MSESTYKFEVAIYLRGDDLDPAHVSEVIGVEPSKSQSRGEKKVTSTNREVVAKIGVWTIAVEKDSNDLSKLVEELASRIGDKAPALSKIAGVQEGYVDVFVASDADEDGGGTCAFQLSKDNVAALSNFAIPIHFTIAVVKK